MPPFEDAPSLPTATFAADGTTAELITLVAWLERALDEARRGDLEGARRAARLAVDPPASALVIEPECRGYSLRGKRVSLGRSAAPRRILRALVDRAERGGTALSRDEIIAAGWPGEKMRADSAAFRVYTAIRRLRVGGLGDVLVTRDDGYLIEGVTVQRLPPRRS